MHIYVHFNSFLQANQTYEPTLILRNRFLWAHSKSSLSFFAIITASKYALTRNW